MALLAAVSRSARPRMPTDAVTVDDLAVLFPGIRRKFAEQAVKRDDR